MDRVPSVNFNLQHYIEKEIIPLYQHFDLAHQTDHVETVIKESLHLAQYYPVDINMVYAIAAFHDTGLSEGRERHHLVSGTIIRSNKILSQYFSAADIETMAQAAEDHRASSKHAPRSIYGKIVAEADRIIDADTIVKRTIQYSLSHFPDYTKSQHYERFCEHMKEKYAEGGYLQLWIPESSNTTRLTAFRELLKDKEQTRQLFERQWGTEFAKVKKRSTNSRVNTNNLV